MNHPHKNYSGIKKLVSTVSGKPIPVLVKTYSDRDTETYHDGISLLGGAVVKREVHYSRKESQHMITHKEKLFLACILVIITLSQLIVGMFTIRSWQQDTAAIQNLIRQRDAGVTQVGRMNTAVTNFVRELKTLQDPRVEAIIAKYTPQAQTQ